jgi:pyridoxine kinase
VGYGEDETGAVIYRQDRLTHYHHPKVGRNFHGTGDMFAACFTGALMQDKNLEDSVKIAADFVCKAIENTCANPAHWYGVKFETALPELIQMIQT